MHSSSFVAILALAVASVTSAATPIDRPLCRPGVERPPNRFNSTERLRKLRDRLPAEADLFLQTDRDRFLASPQPADEFRTWASGFGGSAGDILISRDSSMLFTDSRYTLQADQELECFWQVYEMRFSNWLAANKQRNLTLATDLTQMSGEAYWALKAMDHVTLLPLKPNPIEELWTEGRPERAKQELHPLSIEIAGISFKDKVTRTRSLMRLAELEYLAVTGLDETAYLMNLRGTVVAYKPFFPSRVLLSHQTVWIFFDNKDEVEAKEELRKHLLQDGVSVKNLDEFETVVNELPANQAKVGVDASVTSADVVETLALRNLTIVNAATPLKAMKAKKNSAEVAAYTACSLDDSAALTAFLAELERRMDAGERMTELSAAALLRNYRALLPDFRGLSFETIAAAGPNAAVVHYRPSSVTDRQLTMSDVFLLDSGGQYLGCTTDVTRTMFYGAKPQDEVIAAYTRVLMGVIDLFTLTWPASRQSDKFDAFARHNLWSAGQDYGHGTGHGIGLFLNVHEGPNGIGRQVALEEGNFQSIEPGFYQPEADGVLGFGIRLETISGVRLAPVNRQFLQFEPVTWVPFELKLINVSMLTDRHLQWLNWYHRECRKKLLSKLEDMKISNATDWVIAKTEDIMTGSSGHLTPAWASVLVAGLFALMAAK